MSAANIAETFIWASGILVGAGCTVLLLGGIVYMIIRMADD